MTITAVTSNAASSGGYHATFLLTFIATILRRAHVAHLLVTHELPNQQVVRIHRLRQETLPPRNHAAVARLRALRVEKYVVVEFLSLSPTTGDQVAIRAHQIVTRHLTSVCVETETQQLPRVLLRRPQLLRHQHVLLHRLREARGLVHPLQQRGRHTQLAATNHLVVLPHMTDAEMVLRQPQRRVCQRLLSHHLPFRFVPTAKIPLQKLPVDPLIAFLTRLLRGKRIWRARQLRQPALRHVGHPQVAAAQGIDQEGGRLRVRHLSAVGKVLLQSRVQVCGAALQPLQVAFGAQSRAAVAATDVGHQTRAVARAEYRHRAMRPQMRR